MTWVGRLYKSSRETKTPVLTKKPFTKWKRLIDSIKETWKSTQNRGGKKKKKKEGRNNPVSLMVWFKMLLAANTYPSKDGNSPLANCYQEVSIMTGETKDGNEETREEIWTANRALTPAPRQPWDAATQEATRLLEDRRTRKVTQSQRKQKDFFVAGLHHRRRTYACNFTFHIKRHDNRNAKEMMLESDKITG